ncbi:type II toxin-antitoxin system death-on-curing family toxin [Robiginitomaculum antarcticum]|uniref:type II toxin-antitoxin system death-on-curing family toxin n=1 Tax=Robiginitomaculum antarcticum TaxID=437507 RepID=UPI000369CCD2|nr:type II toxin-antitoxin system death-on-curing family toxin [Robiginitomaculum antarcticum]
MTLRYLSIEDAIAFHDDQLVRFGGADGVRDLGQLASAMFRPQSGYYKDLIEEAAALWESLANNHPFVDGNKRTSLIVTDIFLQLNGSYINCPDDDVWKFMLGLFEQSDFNFQSLDAWLRANIAAL